MAALRWPPPPDIVLAQADGGAGCALRAGARCAPQAGRDRGGCAEGDQAVDAGAGDRERIRRLVCTKLAHVFVRISTRVKLP